jgi:hypothetical protein
MVPEDCAGQRDLPKEFWAALDGLAELQTLHISIVGAGRQTGERTVCLFRPHDPTEGLSCGAAAADSLQMLA